MHVCVCVCVCVRERETWSFTPSQPLQLYEGGEVGGGRVDHSEVYVQ